MCDNRFSGPVGSGQENDYINVDDGRLYEMGAR